MKLHISNYYYPIALVILYFILQPNIFMLGVQTFGLGGDQHLIVNPIMSFASKYDAFQDPMVRLWNGDFELYHSPITNMRYPFFFLWAGDTGNISQTAHHMYLVAHFHHIIGGIGAYVLGRAVGVKPIAAFAGGAFFMLCQNNTLLSPFYWRLAATVWTPFALAAVWLVATGKSPKKGILIGAPAIAMLVFAKSTQPLAYFAYLAFFVGGAGFLATYLKNKSVKDLVSPMIGMAGLVTLSLLMSFPVLYPVIGHAGEYSRWTTDGPVIGGGFKVSYEATQELKYPLHGIWNVLVPLPKMFSIGSSFIGSGAIVAIIAALFSKKYKILTIVMSFVMIYFIINGFGDALKVSRLTYKLPILSSIRQLTSHYIFVVVPATILIAIGFDRLMELGETKRIYAVLAGCFGLSILLAWYMLTHPSLLSSGKNIGLSSIALIIAPIIMGLVAWRRPGKLRYALAAASIILMAMPAADLRVKRTHDFEQSNIYYKHKKIQDTIAAWDDVAKLEKGASVASFVKKRYPEETRKVSHFQLNSLALFAGLRPFNVSYTPRPYKEFKHFNKFRNKPEQAILRGAQYILTDQVVSQIPTRKQLTNIGTYGQMTLFKVEDPYSKGALECMNKRETKDADLLSWCSAEKNYSNVRVTQQSNTKFSYDIEPNGKMFLKHWGWANSSWRATVDGQQADIIAINGDRIAVKVEPGDSQATFTYMPRDYKNSWYAFWLGLFIWLLVVFYAKLRTIGKRVAGSE